MMTTTTTTWGRDENGGAIVVQIEFPIYWWSSKRDISCLCGVLDKFWWNWPHFGVPIDRIVHAELGDISDGLSLEISDSNYLIGL